jgi:hypothetical protein
MEATPTIEVVTSSLFGLLPSNQFVGAGWLVLVVILVSLIKKLVGERASDRVKDIVYPILAAVFSAIGISLGLIDASSISNIVAYLVAPSGIFISVKKILGL